MDVSRLTTQDYCKTVPIINVNMEKEKRKSLTKSSNYTKMIRRGKYCSMLCVSDCARVRVCV